jgi:hypothetical protein
VVIVKVITILLIFNILFLHLFLNPAIFGVEKWNSYEIKPYFIFLFQQTLLEMFHYLQNFISAAIW